jgi:putative ABC transport system ATP-binding protein
MFVKNLNKHKNSMMILENVSKTFQTGNREFTALSNVTFTINRGEYVAVIGKSGSGKSTLLNMLTSIDHPTAGNVVINDTDISNLSETKLAQWRGKNIGIVFQFFQLIPTLTIKENILLAMDFVNTIPAANRLSRANELLQQVDIADQADKMPGALSGGQQQRAAIARALANDPAIIVADEPTGNLDSANASSVHRILASLAQAGKTVIVVTHEKDTNAAYKRTITLSDGIIISDHFNA